jgi:hypothetical protein
MLLNIQKGLGDAETRYREIEDQIKNELFKDLEAPEKPKKPLKKR